MLCPSVISFQNFDQLTLSWMNDRASINVNKSQDTDFLNKFHLLFDYMLQHSLVCNNKIGNGNVKRTPPSKIISLTKKYEKKVWTSNNHKIFTFANNYASLYKTRKTSMFNSLWTFSWRHHGYSTCLSFEGCIILNTNKRYIYDSNLNVLPFFIM